MSCIELLLNRTGSHLSTSLLIDDIRPRVDVRCRAHFPLLDFAPFDSPPPPVPSPRDTQPALPKSLGHPRRHNINSPCAFLHDYIISPVELGFIPAGQWAPGPASLSAVIAGFFSARSSRTLRFEHKLWNALALTKTDALLYDFVGVMWLTRTVFKVNRDVFGSFINVTRPAAALYNNQGSFATHGFREVRLQKLIGCVDPDDLRDVDESIVRLFEHTTPLFNMCSTDGQVLRCRYVHGPW
jgi:hypothetical protein